MASSIPSARTAFVDALEALQATSLVGVSVIRSGTAKPASGREQITVRNAIDITRQVRLGGTHFQEQYTVPVEVYVQQAGADVEAVETRMWALMTVVEQTIVADRAGFGGTVVSANPADIPDGEQSGVVDDRHVYATATLNVSCIAAVNLA